MDNSTKDEISEIVLCVLKDNSVILGELKLVEDNAYYFYTPLVLVVDFQKNKTSLVPFTYPLPNNHLYLKNVKNIEKIHKNDILRMYTSEELVDGLEKDYIKFVREMRNPEVQIKKVTVTIH